MGRGIDYVCGCQLLSQKGFAKLCVRIRNYRIGSYWANLRLERIRNPEWRDPYFNTPLPQVVDVKQHWWDQGLGNQNNFGTDSLLECEGKWNEHFDDAVLDDVW